MTMENTTGISPDEVAFRISSEYHYGYDLLEEEHKEAAQSGAEVVVYNSGAVEVVDLEESDSTEEFNTVTIPKGTFPWFTEDYQAPFEEIDVDGWQIQIIDVSGADKKLSRIGKRLNGSSGRADIAVRHRVSESVLNGGVVAGAQPFLDDPRFPTIFSMESGDHSNSKKVRVFFTLPTPDSNKAYKVAACTFADQRKTEIRLKQLQS